MDKPLGYIECEVLCFEDDLQMDLSEMGVDARTEFRWGLIMIDKITSIVPRDNGNTTVSMVDGDALEINEPCNEFTNRVKNVLDKSING